MIYDFDRVVDRKQTNDMKWNSKAISSYVHLEIPENIIPMWLADTEFAIFDGGKMMIKAV